MKQILLVAICYSSSFLVSAQKELLKTWYLLEPNGESSQRIIISTDEITMEKYVNYDVDVPYWEVDKKSPLVKILREESSYQIVGKDEDNQFYSGEFWISGDGQELNAFQLRQGSTSEKEALQKLQASEFRKLMTRTFYQKERMDEINKLPSLDALTKEDLIATIREVRSNEEVLTAFVESETPNASRFVVRVARQMFESELMKRGYNPFKITENGYFVDRFKDDPEIQKLMEGSVHFKF